MAYFLNVIYKDGDQDSYKAIELTSSNKKLETKFFDTGNPVIDLINVYKFLHKQGETATVSSSYDHFFMDGNTYTWCRIDRKTSKLYFRTDELEKDFPNDDYEEKTTEYIIPGDGSIKSYEDLHEYYKTNKKLLTNQK